LKLSLYWQAWKVLPLIGKILFFAGEIISAFIYWSGTQATIGQPGLGGIVVTSDMVFQTKLEGLGLLGLVSGIFIFSLVTIAVTLDNHPEKIPVSKPREQSRFANPFLGTGCLMGASIVSGLILLTIYRISTGFFTGDLTYVWFGLFAWICISLGLFMVGFGSIMLWLQTKKPKSPPSVQ
jgi:hypothetical protein